MMLEKKEELTYRDLTIREYNLIKYAYRCGYLAALGGEGQFEDAVDFAFGLTNKDKNNQNNRMVVLDNTAGDEE